MLTVGEHLVGIWARLRAVSPGLLRFASCLLLCTGAIKIISAFSGVVLLLTPDPVLSFVSNRWLLIVAGHVEVVLALALLFRPDAWYARHGLLALCCCFLAYRAALLTLAGTPPCPCLGRASDWLHLTPEQADRIAVLLLLLFLVSALLAIASHGAGNRAEAEPVREPELPSDVRSRG